MDDSNGGPGPSSARGSAAICYAKREDGQAGIIVGRPGRQALEADRGRHLDSEYILTAQRQINCFGNTRFGLKQKILSLRAHLCSLLFVRTSWLNKTGIRQKIMSNNLKKNLLLI
jgi:hypothetical protein